MPAIETLKIKGFKAFPSEFKLSFDGKHLLLYGENGSGKSSIYYALHCLFQSPLKKDSGKKYFNKLDDEGNENHQNLLNINVLGDDSHVSVSFCENHPFIYEINKDGYKTTLYGGRHPLPADINGVFINHKFLFYFFSFRNSEQINLFPVFEKDILPFVLDKESGLHIGEMYDTITSSVIKKANKVTKDYLSNIEYFNMQISNVVEEVNLRASDLYCAYFKEDTHPKLKIVLYYQSTASKSPNDSRQYWLEYNNFTDYVNENGKIVAKQTKYKALNKPFIRLEVSEELEEGFWRVVPKPQAYFNEAKLTAIALSIRFALLNLDAPEDGRFLALDDMLISLDMSNRTKVIDFLLRISDKYKIYLFTHDKILFDLMKMRIEQNKHLDWCFYEMYTDEKNHKPIVLLSDTYYSKACYHLQSFDYPAAGNYFRKAAEELVEKYFPTEVIIGNDGQKRRNLKNYVDAAIGVYERIGIDTTLLEALDSYVFLLLNPLSHRSIETNVYKTELNKVKDLIPNIMSEVQSLNLRELIAAQNSLVIVFHNDIVIQNEYTITTKEPIYLFNRLGVELLSKSQCQSTESLTITNGVLSAKSKNNYFKENCIIDVHKKIFERWTTPYDESYMNNIFHISSSNDRKSLQSLKDSF